MSFFHLQTFDISVTIHSYDISVTIHSCFKQTNLKGIYLRENKARNIVIKHLTNKIVRYGNFFSLHALPGSLFLAPNSILFEQSCNGEKTWCRMLCVWLFKMEKIRG